jgi:enoyl-CoA hydratase/carnithine racemase
MEYQTILVKRAEPVTTVTLNRPEKRNALSIEMMTELRDCLDEIGRDKYIRAVVLAANGKVFSSGHDLSEMTGQNVDHYRHVFDLCTQLMTKIQTIPQPVIAAVQGVATAAGCQLAATCDLVVAAQKATFSTPGVKIGLFCTTPMVALTRAIGRKRAMEMLLTGCSVKASTAADWGLVNHVVLPNELADFAHMLAGQVANASSYTISVGKQAFYAQIDMDQARAYEYAKDVMSANAVAADAQEGMTAFLEKREPCWTGH